ncbi:MAG TPA: hypothetical protein VM912_04415, partial [Terriglobales bacterium]|nr:hypothetical protein [Terriglobales bacterium]
VLRRRKTPRAIVGANELLIAIIHGYGAEGWRNPQARQAYLVRNGGSAPLRAIPAPGHVEGAPISISHSQIICAESKRPGFLFWTGSQYGWRTIHTPEQAAAVAKSRD